MNFVATKGIIHLLFMPSIPFLYFKYLYINLSKENSIVTHLPNIIYYF